MMPHPATLLAPVLAACLAPAARGLHHPPPGRGPPAPQGLGRTSGAAPGRRRECPGPYEPAQALARGRRHNRSWPERAQDGAVNFAGHAGTFPGRACLEAPPIHEAYCSLAACRHNGIAAPHLFIDLNDTDVETSMLNIIEGMLVANLNGMNFGGVLSGEGSSNYSSYNAYIAFRSEGVMQKLFGVANPVNLEWYGTPPCFRAEFANVTDMEWFRPYMDFGENVYLPSVGGVPRRAYDHYLDSKLIAELALPLERFQLAFKPNVPWIAIHVARDPQPWKESDDRNKYYHGLVDAIRKIYPDADVHVWSTKYVRNLRLYNETDLDDFRKRGVTVHLEECDLVDSWAHLSRAHVFIMSRSSASFSLVPAILSTQCVIYSHEDEMRFHSAPRKHVLGDNLGRPTFQAELQACISGYERVCPECTETTTSVTVTSVTPTSVTPTTVTTTTGSPTTATTITRTSTTVITTSTRTWALR